MKKIFIILFSFFCVFVGINSINAADVYCKEGYELYTNSNKEKECKKNAGNPYKEFNQWHCGPETHLIDDTCYYIEYPIVDGCEHGYEPFQDTEGNKKCKKKLDDTEITKLIETFCKKDSSCEYLKNPNKGKMKCEEGYELYTDSSGNKKCKKSLGAPMTEFGMKTCPRGDLINGTCYSIKDPLESNNGCESGYKLYTDSSKKQKCKKIVDDTEITKLMTQICDSDSKCQYIKNIVEKPKEEEETKTDTSLQPGGVVTGCEVIPEEIRRWINNILKFVRYVALALVIALGALDFMKAAGSGEPDAMKKAGQSFMKRMIAVVILFLLPVIVEFILNMINIYGVPKDNIDCL